MTILDFDVFKLYFFLNHFTLDYLTEEEYLEQCLQMSPEPKSMRELHQLQQSYESIISRQHGHRLRLAESLPDARKISSKDKDIPETHPDDVWIPITRAHRIPVGRQNGFLPR